MAWAWPQKAFVSSKTLTLTQVLKQTDTSFWTRFNSNTDRCNSSSKINRYKISSKNAVAYHSPSQRHSNTNIAESKAKSKEWLKLQMKERNKVRNRRYLIWLIGPLNKRKIRVHRRNILDLSRVRLIKMQLKVSRTKSSIQISHLSLTRSKLRIMRCLRNERVKWRKSTWTESSWRPSRRISQSLTPPCVLFQPSSGTWMKKWIERFDSMAVVNFSTRKS